VTVAKRVAPFGRARFAAFGVLAWLALANSASAQQPFARARLEPRGTVTVGQPVQLVVEVFVSTWFARAPEFPSLDIENAIVTPPGRSLNLNERVDGQQYFGIRRSYTIYPQVAGDYEVPEIAVTVRPGGSDDIVTVRARTSNLEVRIPAEATGLDYFIGTTQLTVSGSVEPRADTFRVGDAIVRTVTATVYDALSLVIPPLTFDSIPGLALYPDPPRTSDEGGERGERIVGSRTESATYVMLEEGDYELPAVEIAWWDLNANRLRRSTVESIAFHVEPNPDYAPEFAPIEPNTVVAEAAPADSRLSPRTIALALGALLLVAVLFWLARRFGPRLVERLAEWRRQREESEAAYLARLRRACRTNDPHAAMQALLAWLDRTSPSGTAATVASFVAAAHDAELATAANDLSELLYGDTGTGESSWDGADLYRAVRRHRRSRIAAAPTFRGGDLAPLNPREQPQHLKIGVRPLRVTVR